MKSLLKNIYNLCFIFIFLSSANATDQIEYKNGFYLRLPNCDAKYVENPEHSPNFFATLKTVIKDRKFKLKSYKKRAQINEGELYFMVKLTKSKSAFYKDCNAEVSLKRAKSGNMSSRDKVLVTKIVTRKFPRLTMSGDERCLLALKDAFVHIPTCKSGF
jgi:hypothetical protein